MSIENDRVSIADSRNAWLAALLELGVCAFIFLLPWQTRWIGAPVFIDGFRVSYGEITVYATQLLLWALFFIYGLWLWRGFRRVGWINGQIFSRAKRLPWLSYWLSVIFVLWCGITTFWAINTSSALQQWLWLTQSLALASMVIVVPIRRERMVFAWLAAGVVQSGLAWWQYVAQHIAPNKWLGMAEHIVALSGTSVVQMNGERLLRAYGSLPHPNILGGFLTIGLLCALWFAITAQEMRARAYALLASIIIASGLFITFSRSAWLGAFFGISILLASHWRNRVLRRDIRKIAIVMCVVGVCMGVIFRDALLTRVGSSDVLEQFSTTQRMTSIAQAGEVFLQHSFIGVGVGNYLFALDLFITFQFTPELVHLLFAMIATETGVVGLLLWLSAFIGLLIIAWRNRATQFGGIVGAALCAILVISFFDHYFWTTHVGLTMWFVIAGLTWRGERT